MRKRNMFYWALITVLVVIPLLVAYVREVLAVSACRKTGGSFDYMAMTCDPTGAVHAHAPFGARHPGLLALTVMILFFVAVAKWVTWRRKLDM